MRFFVARDRRDYIHIYDMLNMANVPIAIQRLTSL